MVSIMLSRFVVLTFGTIYPAYRSYKAVRTKDTREYVKWMMYWIVWACFCLLETVLDVLVAFWFPFYYEAKILFVIYLLSPWTKGASILYRKWVHPTLQRHERDIDALLDQAKVEGYGAVLRLGSRGIYAARDLIAVAAIRGQLHLSTQLRRSYSANDINLDATDATDAGTHWRRRANTGQPRGGPRIEQIHEEAEDQYSDSDRDTDHREQSSGVEEEVERVWEGNYNGDGELVTEVQVRRSTRTTTAGHPPWRNKKTMDAGGDSEMIVDGYATLPRSSRGGAGGSRQAQPRPKISSAF